MMGPAQNVVSIRQSAISAWERTATAGRHSRPRNRERGRGGLRPEWPALFVRPGMAEKPSGGEVNFQGADLLPQLRLLRLSHLSVLLDRVQVGVGRRRGDLPQEFLVLAVKTLDQV